MAKDWLVKAESFSAADLRIALDASLRLQRHYAKLLNQWDGGERMIFEDAASWIARLRETNTLPQNDEKGRHHGKE